MLVAAVRRLAFLGPAGVAAALLSAAVVTAPLAGGDRFAEGRVVRYAEDRTGGPWGIVRPYGFGRYMIRRLDGDAMLCIADAHEITPFPERR